MRRSANDDPGTQAPRSWARRQVVHLLAALAVATSAFAPDAPSEAARRRVRGEHNRRDGGKTTILCYQGETKRVRTRRRKRWLRQGATRGKCSGCTPVCAPGSCGDDGCGGSCPGCAAGTQCIDAACTPCTVTCTGEPAACGEALATALQGTGDIVLCPGTYQGNFTINRSVRVFGSGSGSNPAVDSILAGDAGRPVTIQDAFTILLSEVAITNGDGGIHGGGIWSNNATLTIDRCSITGNTGRDGAGLKVSGGSTTIRNSRIADNGPAGRRGGGLHATDAAVLIENSAFTGNSSEEEGGGLFLEGGSCTFDSASSVTGNSTLFGAGSGGGIYGTSGNAPAVSLNGATVSGNTPDDCGGSVSC